jgi:hypothetical protein
MGITKHDLKVLRQTSSKLFRLGCITGTAVVSIIFLAGAVNNIGLCRRFAAMAGLTVREVFSRWITGVSVSDAHLEMVLLATQRLQMALISVVVVALLAVALWALLTTSYRNARILKSLKGKKR